MESQRDIQSRSSPTDMVHLNQATVEELTKLPGIGQTLAQRVIAHRDESGPFADPEEIKNVPGIGAIVYQRLADRITVEPPASSQAEAPEATSEQEELAAEGGQVTEEKPIPIPPPGEAFEEEPDWAADVAEEATVPPSQVRAPQRPLLVEPEHPEPSEEAEAPKPAPELEIAAEEAEPEEPEEAAPPPPEAERPTGLARLSWLWSALLGAVLGGLLGMFLSLLVFAGINGAVDVNRTQAMRQLRSELSGLSTEVNAIRNDVSTVQGDVDGLRQRVDVLSGLTARMERAEQTLETFTEEILALRETSASLQESVDMLTEDVGTLEQAVDELEVQTERTLSFFGQLRELLNNLLGEPPQGVEGENK
ncbi:MAG: helix-hairpin-helix domain-containing protein [Anaerolineae bacterium]